MKGMLRSLVGLLTVVAMSAVADGVPGRVADLGWMAGYWKGPFGEDTLEEHWMHPSDDTVVGSVRVTRDGVTRIKEFIVIEQAGDTLLFRVSQFQPGMKPIHDEPPIMTLTEIGDRRVAFESAGGFVFRTLAYSRPEEDRFVIEAELATGEPLQLKLAPVR
ncbi:MAG: hypothetical protein JJU22_00230 [Gammaproteobacteria bacterium]|nr:hypothetical protein [Gammaproteobacteria bacterium]